MQNISAAEVRSRIKAGESLNLVDVREADEHDDFNIGGILLPLRKIQSLETEEIDHLKDDEVILYCRTGNRSGQAGLFLEMMGFSNIKNMIGGVVEFRNLS